MCFYDTATMFSRVIQAGFEELKLTSGDSKGQVVQILQKGNVPIIF